MYWPNARSHFSTFPLVGYTLRNSCVHEGASPNFTIWGQNTGGISAFEPFGFQVFRAAKA
jgi:hypothetical protein